MTTVERLHNMELWALADSENQNLGVQYGVSLPSGTVRIYGDQRWVQGGGAVEDEHPDGVTLARTVTVSYGPWRQVVDMADEAMHGMVGGIFHPTGDQ